MVPVSYECAYSIFCFLEQIFTFLIHCWFANGPPYTEDKRRLKKEVDHSGLVGGKLNKQGHLKGSGPEMSRTPHRPARIFSVHIGALPGLSSVYCPDGLNETSFSLRLHP